MNKFEDMIRTRIIQVLFYVLTLTLIVGCAKRTRSINKIDFLCDQCIEYKEEAEEVRTESSDEHSVSKTTKYEKEQTDHGTIKSPIIFEYEVLKEELNVKTYEDMFNKAMQLYSSGEIETSSKIFKVLADNAPNNYYKEVAMFNLAIGIERLGYEKEALEIYEELTKSDEKEIREDAILRSARIKLAQGSEIDIEPSSFSEGSRRRFAQTLLLLDSTEKMLTEILGKTPALDIISDSVASNIDQKTYDHMKKNVEKLLSDINKMFFTINPKDESEIKTILYLCRGNIYFMEAALTPNTDNESIKKKVRHLIDAQREYFYAVKEKHPWWMTAGVFKIGETYRYLFENITSSPIPKELKTEEEKQLYKSELLKEFRRALDLAHDVYEKNINFSKRIKLRTVWITRSEEEIKKIKHYAELVQKFIEEVDKTEEGGNTPPQ